MKYLTSLIVLLVNISFGQIPKPSFGKIIHLEHFHSKFIKERNIDIWLPDSYIEDRKQKYDVLYMNDGQMLFDSSITWNKQEWLVDETMTNLMQSGKIRKTIVVGISNGGKERHVEFTPQQPFENLPDFYKDSVINFGKRNNGNSVFSGNIISDMYLKFVVEELKPFIDQNYRTHTKSDHTFMAGSSMGGLISLYAICEYPKIFGGVACLSTHWPVLFQTENNLFPSAINNYLLNHLPKPGKHKIYFDYGDQTLDLMYQPYQQMIDETMKHVGYSEKNWKTNFFEGDDHSEKSWAKRFSTPVLFLLGK